MSFSDHRGPGGVFRLMPVRTVSADQLGLSREVQSLALEPEGLVLITGSRSSGKRALISSLVDLINRNRRDHVITIEREVNIVHARGSSFISQREVRGTDDDVLAAARAALREDPDVLVLEQIRTGLLMNVALEAAASGHLVIGGFRHTTRPNQSTASSVMAPELRAACPARWPTIPRRRGSGSAENRRRTGGGARGAPEYGGRQRRDRRGKDVAAADGHRRRTPGRHGSAERRARGLRPGGIVDMRDAHGTSHRPPSSAVLKRQGVDTSALSEWRNDAFFTSTKVTKLREASCCIKQSSSASCPSVS
jgi:hypothetical protein